MELLICEDYIDADFKAEQLNTENTHRHEVEMNIADDIEMQTQENPALVEDRVIVISGENYHKGVIGIVAAHVCEKYGKPAIIIGVDENGEATGSARSVDGFNIFEAISHCSDILTHFGGHPLAAGLGLEAENIDLFRKQINDFARINYPVMPCQTLCLDCKLSPFYLNLDLADSLTALEPYGAGNFQPIFGLYGMKLISVTPMGEGRHIRLEVQKKNKNLRIVKFGMPAEDFPYKTGDVLDFAVKLSKNYFKGKYYLSIQAVDIRRNGIDDARYFVEKSDYQLFKLGYDAKTKIFPNRDIFTAVYKFLKQNDGWKYSFDDLYFSLNGITYGQLSFALDAFSEAGLIEINTGISLVAVQKKADLENTNVIKTLKGRLEID